MGEVGDGLDGALEEKVTHFVEQECEDYGDGETDEEFIEADDDGVAKDFKEFGQGEQGLEVLEADPGAAQKSADR